MYTVYWVTYVTEDGTEGREPCGIDRAYAQRVYAKLFDIHYCVRIEEGVA